MPQRVNQFVQKLSPFLYLYHSNVMVGGLTIASESKLIQSSKAMPKTFILAILSVKILIYQFNKSTELWVLQQDFAKRKVFPAKPNQTKGRMFEARHDTCSLLEGEATLPSPEKLLYSSYIGPIPRG